MEPAFLDELAEFIRIPSVSADPAHADDIRRAGDWLAGLVRRLGGEVEVLETGANPLVVGEIRASSGAESAPTVLAYGHYDVQPPAPLELWDSDPFELTIRDGWVYGRGIADDKGQLYLLVKAAGELAKEGSLPVNVRVVSDGEEEIGGQSVVEFLADDERGADACVIFDGGFERRGVPEFGIGTRGLLDLDLRVATNERDLHSGLFGNAALNAIHALTQGLAAVLPRNGRLPDALREGAIPFSAEERAGLAELTPGADVLREAGAVPYDEAAPDDFYERTLAEPAVDVNGILGGKPGLTNTTVPAAAQANFTMRLAPGQDPGRTFETLKQMIHEAAPAGARLELTLKQSAAGALVAPDSLAVRLGMEAFERVFRRGPLLVRSGGTLPIMPALVEKGIPTMIAGVALPDSNIHSPNERLLHEYVPLGLAAARELFVSFARLR